MLLLTFQQYEHRIVFPSTSRFSSVSKKRVQTKIANGSDRSSENRRPISHHPFRNQIGNACEMSVE